MTQSRSVSDLIDLMEEPVEGNPPSFIEKIWLRFKKRARITLSYKLYFFTRYIRVFLSVIIYVIFSFIVSGTQLTEAGYVGTYGAYAVIGIATARLINTSFRGLGRIIRREQQKGTIEAVLSSKSSFYVILLGDMIYYYLYASSFFLMAILIGIALPSSIAQFTLTTSSILTTFIMLILSCFAHLALALLSAAAILQFKEANPVTRALNWLQRFLGGMYFPTTLLPRDLNFISQALPLTHSMHGIRLALLNGASIFHPAVLTAARNLLLFGIIMFPIGGLLFKHVYTRVRRDGTLAEY